MLTPKQMHQQHTIKVKTWHKKTSNNYWKFLINFITIKSVNLFLDLTLNRMIFIRKAFIIIDLHGKLLIAEREFIGKNWLSSLTDLGLHFVIRLRKGMYRSQIHNMGVSYDELERKALKRSMPKSFFNLIKGFTNWDFGVLTTILNPLYT